MNAEALKNLADWISGQVGVKIVFSSSLSTASTDLNSKTIYMPTFVPDDMVEPLTALIDHEAKHLFASDPNIVERRFWTNGRLKELMNILEDIRINAALAKDFPTYRRMMKSFFLMVYTDEKKFNFYEETDDNGKPTGRMLPVPDISKKKMMIIFEGNFMDMKYPKGYDKGYRADQKTFEDFIKQAIAAQNLFAVSLVCDELYRFLYGEDPKAPPPVPPPPPKPPKPGKEPGKKPGKGEGEGEPGEGEGEPDRELTKTEKEALKESGLDKDLEKSKKGNIDTPDEDGEGEGEPGEGEGEPGKKPGKGEGKPSAADLEKQKKEYFRERAKKVL